MQVSAAFAYVTDLGRQLVMAVSATVSQAQVTCRTGAASECIFMLFLAIVAIGAVIGAVIIVLMLIWAIVRAIKSLVRR